METRTTSRKKWKGGLRDEKVRFCNRPERTGRGDDGGSGQRPNHGQSDRSSTYFLVAKAEKEQNGEITAALIENKAGLEPDEQFYGVHLIDDISMSDCRLVSTDSLEADGLVETLEGVYAGLKKSLSDGGASDDFERK